MLTPTPPPRAPPQYPWRAAALRIAAAAMAYFALGRLAIALAIAPGYAAPVWPAAGVAVAAVLIWGWRIWPGIFFGSLLVNLHIGLAGGALDPALALASSTLIALGAALQAVAASVLLATRAPARDYFASGREVMLFLIAVGPLACVVNATLGPLALVSLGIVGMDELAFTSWNWWVGDTIGVIVVAPVALIASGWAGRRWRRRRLQIAIPMLLAVAVVVTAFVHSSERDYAHIGMQFHNAGRTATAAVENELAATLDTLSSLRSFFDSSSQVTRTEFATFAGGLLDGQTALLALSWNPYISHEQREWLERGAGVAEPVTITARDDRGRLVAAPVASDYVAVRYIEPFEQNATAAGFDLLSEPTRRAAIMTAIATGRPAATGGIHLVQDGAGRTGLLLVAPVYPHEPGQQPNRAARPDGFVVAVVVVDDLIRTALGRVPTHLLGFRLLDATDNYARLGAWPEQPPEPVELRRLDTLPFAGREWRLEVSAGRDFIAANRADSLWLILAGGLLLSGMLGAFLIVLTGHAVRAQQRRDELQRLNAQLEDNVVRRRRAELDLSAEKARAEATLRSIADGVVALRADERVEYMNPVAEQLTGWPIAEAAGQPLDDILQLQAEDDEGEARSALALCRHHEDPGVDGGLWLTSRNGERYAIRQSVRELAAGAGASGGYVIAFQDVTAARREALEMARQATHDPLTGLVNRTEFERRMRHAVKGARMHGVSHTFCFLDLDHFKQVNDTAGHATGDRVLREICTLLRKRIRSRDTLARLGGDEFGLLLDHCPISRAVEIARDIVSDVCAYRLAWRGESLQVGISIGAAAITAATECIDTVVQAADSACYAAKSAGRNRVVVADSEPLAAARS